MITKKFIVLEGISGSGKTHLGKELANRISGRYYTTPPDLFKSMRRNADKKLCLESRFLFYISAIIQASKEISQILETQDVVCDKYIWSTICYHSVFGLNMEIPSVYYLHPDFTFLIVCEEKKRLRRLVQRPDHKHIQDEKKYALRQEHERLCLLEYRKHNLQEIDNTEDGFDLQINKMLNFIQKGDSF